jgi:hypothetical protein
VVFNVGFGSYQGVTLNNQTIPKRTSTQTPCSRVVFATAARSAHLRPTRLLHRRQSPAGTSLNGHTNFYVSSSVGAIFGLLPTTSTASSHRAPVSRLARSGCPHPSRNGARHGGVPENLTITAKHTSSRWIGALRQPGQSLVRRQQSNHTPAYFSLDGGATVITHWGTESET